MRTTAAAARSGRTGRPDFAYGNTRLRARRPDLLDAAAYEAMIDRDLDGLLGALSTTPYAADLDQAVTRYHGARRVHEAVRRHLGRTLEEMRSFYSGRARLLVDILLSRWDLQNTLVVIRAESVRTKPDDALAHVVPLGAFSDAVAREVARQHELSGAIQLLVRWQLPDPETAAALRSALAVYERVGDLAELEQRVTASWTARTSAELLRLGRDAAALLSHVQRDIDERNVTVALRLRTDDELDEGLASHFLPGGVIAAASLEAAVRGMENGAVAGALTRLRPEWERALKRWAASGDLVQLQYDLDVVRVEAATKHFAFGDPLGIGIPVAYTVAKETEARNIRLIAEGTARGLDRDRVRSRLLLPGSRR
ncbi:vacuolar-type H+-ATPase subunit C/Vma6 [Microbacterium sp. AK009]|uniref:V-type ATPase subunit n=1 Tax=Microbacterium sp. AK009 TaxID=2723068 RepID=UPI0015CEA267|nr:V-type ATPase subunit [Microbacterium sp. AK009]NYF16576.1 vacuolar-type H+-ATPase subunit C/Vma6 [Microbacterium sp. AK009]